MKGYYSYGYIPTPTDQRATKARQAFITGSRRYGSPKPTSDLDLVIRVTREEAELIAAMAHAQNRVYPQHRVIRFGYMNLIVATTDRQWDAWYCGTRALYQKRPVDRATAVKTFRRMEDLLEVSLDYEVGR